MIRVSAVFAAFLLGVCVLTARADDDASLRYFRDLAETRNFTLGQPQSPKLTPDGAKVIFLRSGPREPVLRLYEFDVADGKVRELLTPEQILKSTEEQLSPEEKARRERQRQSLKGFTSFQLSKDGMRVLVLLGGKLYVVERASGAFQEMPGAGWIAPQLSPDGKWIGAARANELYVIDIAARKEKQLTTGANEVIHHAVAEFAAQEEMARFDGFWWSADSQSLAYQETDHTGVEVRYIADPLQPAEPPAKQFYPRTGTKNAVVKLGVIARGGGATKWIEWDREKFPYLARVDWSTEKAPLTVYVLDRLQKNSLLLAVDAKSGATRELLRESDTAWLNIGRKTNANWRADGASFFWPTERSGRWNLEQRGLDGKLLRPITTDADGFMDLVRETKLAGVEGVFISAQPALPLGGGETDARQRHVRFVPLAGAGGRRDIGVTGGGLGMVELGEGKSENRLLIKEDRMDGEGGWTVRDEEFKVIATLPSIAEKPTQLPAVEFARVSGERSYHAAILRPRDFKKGATYPVLLDVYAGPEHQQVTARLRSYFVSQWYADQGFIVVSIDGRGTPGRGRDWERAIQGNLVDVPLADQIDGLRAVAKQVPEMDLNRVGVSGWSFGGYFSAMAAIRRPDVFACGVAGAPVVTWENYDTTYTERYLGLPKDQTEAYRVSSVLTYAKELKRPLLLIHGATDDNVYFQHSVQLADALYREGKTYEFLPLLGTHMITDPLSRLRRESRVLEFLQRNTKAPEAAKP